MTDQELKELVASLSVAQKETSAQLKELGKQLGGLGEKFGSFTEGMAFPAMEKILRERFKMNVVALRVEAHKDGDTLEMDVLAYSNSGVKEVYIVEVKSHLREEGLEQLLDQLRNFTRFFPEHKDKKLFGILAVVEAPKHLEKRVAREGIYLAKIHDDLFELQIPEGFNPKNFQASI